MLLQHLAHRRGLADLALVQIRVHVGRRRRHGRRQDVLEQPLAPNRRRGAGRVRRHGQHARLAEQPPAVLVGQRHAPEVAAVHAGNPVVARELLVEKRRVRRQQLHDAAVGLQLIVEEQLRLAHERRAQVVVEPGKLRVGIGRQQPDVARLQPLAEEVVHQRGARARIGEHAPHLLIEDAAHRCSLPANRQIEQLIVGNAAPEKERQTRRELDIGQTIGGARRHRVGIGFDAEQEIRADQQPLERRANAAVEAAVGTRASDRSRAASAHRRSSPDGDTPAARASTGSSSRRRSRQLADCRAGTRRCAGGSASPAAPGRCTARRSAATRWQVRRWARRLRDSRSACAPGPSPSALTSSDLTMVARTWRRPAFSGTRTCSFSSAFVGGSADGAADRELPDARAIDSNLDRRSARSALESHRRRSCSRRTLKTYSPSTGK